MDSNDDDDDDDDDNDDGHGWTVDVVDGRGSERLIAGRRPKL